MRARVKMGFERRRRPEDAWTRPPPTAEDLAWREWADACYEYRIVVFDRPVTKWGSLRGTQQAAIRMGHGSRCDRTGLLYMTVPAAIQSRRVEPPPKPPRELCYSRRRGR